MKRPLFPLCMCMCCLVLIFPLLFLLTGCSDPDAEAAGGADDHSLTFFAMDASVTFTAYTEGAGQALAQAQDKLIYLERLWSATDKGGDIYAVNHAGGKPVSVADETAELLDFTLRMSERTDGALDPTVYPVLTAWGFTTGESRIPSEDEIASLLPLVGYENVSLSGSTVQLPDGVMLDLGAVEKGYAGDIIAELLRENGITSALLNLGGSVIAVGKQPDGSDFLIRLKDPTGNGIVGDLMISDLAAVTSGAYERYFIGEDGELYSHMIDPETGYPVKSGLLSVTVIAKEGKVCGALSSSLFVMGAERAIEYWRQDQNFDMILITESRDIYLTSGISERFTVDESHSYMNIYTISE